MDTSNNIFKELYMKLMQISLDSIDKDDLLILIAKLNGLNYKEKIPFITTWTCTDMLLQVMGMLKEFGQDQDCLTQLSQLIVNVASKQKIVVCSMSVNVILHGLKDVWFETLTQNAALHSSSELLNLLLCAISAVVYGNGAYIMPELLEWLVGKEGKSGSIGLLLLSPASMELKKLCLQCLSGLCVTSESRENLNEEYMHYCLQLFIQALQTIPHVKDVPHYRVIFASHKGLQYILDGPSGIHVHEIGPLLAILKKHLVFGLSFAQDDAPFVLEPLPIPDAIYSKAQSTSQISASPAVKSLKKKKKRSRPKQASAITTTSSGVHTFPSYQSNGITRGSFQATGTLNSDNSNAVESPLNLKFHVTSSESEYSDTEGGQFSAMTSFALKIRQMAIGSLYAIVKKTSKLVMLGYWNSFVAGSSATNGVSLLSCITNDPAPKARVGALMVLCAMLDGSRAFLSLAIQKGVSSSFVSFSDVLTSSVHDVHNTLLRVITKDRSSLVQVHILKAISSLAANSPYTKLTKGFVTNIIKKVRSTLSASRDVDIRIGALNVFISLLSSEPALEEVMHSMVDEKSLSASDKEHGDISVASGQSHNFVTASKFWLVEDCMALCPQNDGGTDVPLPLRIAALQLLTMSCKHYFSMVKCYLSELTSVICKCLYDKNSTVRLHASKLIVEFGGSLLKTQQKDKVHVSQNIAFWKELLSGPVQSISQDEDDFNRSHSCDVLAAIGPLVFESLPRNLQLFCQALLLGLTSDENYLVRSAAIRSLAVYVMYPILRKDICFVEDVAGCILKLMNDPAKGVQYNAAWSFGNFTDAIIINVENEERQFSRDMIRNSLLMELIGTAIKAFDNKDKVRFNMMRVLGNLLRFFDQTHVQNQRFRVVISQAKSVIVNAMLKDPLMKVRWNACLACGNLLRNSHLPIDQPGWADDVYSSLCATVSSSKNYKVCIKAAIALGCPATREFYGKHFLNVYECILISLKASEVNEVDFGEYKFKEKLQEHLVYTLLHITIFLKAEDLMSIFTTLLDFSLLGIVETHISRLRNVVDVKKEFENLSLTESEAYAALGQFSKSQKQSMFKNASSRWTSVISSFSDSAEFKDLSVDENVLSRIILLFSQKDGD